MTIKRGMLYQFMAEQRPSRQMFRSLWAINAGVSALLIVGGVFVFIQWVINLGKTTQNNSLIAVGLVVLILLMLNAIKSAAAAWVTSADIEAGSDGVYLHVREGKPTLVQWDAIQEEGIKKVQMPLLFPLKGQHEAYIVPAVGLGILYRLAGFEYGQGFKPVFIVTTAHDGYRKLVDQLEDAAEEDVSSTEANSD